MLEQLTLINSQTRPGEFAGRLDSSAMQALDSALRGEGGGGGWPSADSPPSVPQPQTT